MCLLTIRNSIQVCMGEVEFRFCFCTHTHTQMHLNGVWQNVGFRNKKRDAYAYFTCDPRMFLVAGFLCHAASHCGFLGQNFPVLVKGASVLQHSWHILKVANRL